MAENREARHLAPSFGGASSSVKMTRFDAFAQQFDLDSTAFKKDYWGTPKDPANADDAQAGQQAYRATRNQHDAAVRRGDSRAAKYWASIMAGLSLLITIAVLG